MKLIVSALFAAVILLQPMTGMAAPRKPTTDLTKQAMGATRDQWIAFRNYNGEQLVYFTSLIAWKCGLNEIRYSINNESLDQTFPLPACNPQTPFAVDPTYTNVFLRFPPGTVQTISVQLIYGDDTKSEMVTYKPCNLDEDTTCAIPVKRGEEN